MIALKFLQRFWESGLFTRGIMNTLQILQKPLINPVVFNSECEEKSPLILVAEEKLEDRLVIKELLDLYNARILHTKNGEETVDFTIIHRPDLIFIDTALPGLNAFEAAHLIRLIYAFHTVPIIFLSDYPERTERYKAFDAGADDYLIKPLDLDRIDNILEKYCF